MDKRIYTDITLRSLKEHLNSNNKFITYPKFIFLCGVGYKNSDEYEKSNRYVIESYMKKKSSSLFFILSEDLWLDEYNAKIDLLTFEEFLAEVCDSIILFVESYGSACELGAFSYANNLFSDKLTIVLDNRFKNDKSFIRTGPIAKAEKDGSEIVYASVLDGAVLSSKTLRNVLDKKLENFSSKTFKANKRIPNKNSNKVYISTFILELLELIRLLSPIQRSDLLDIYKELKEIKNFSFVKKDDEPFHNNIPYDFILKLLEYVKLIETNSNVITYIGGRTQSLMFNYSIRSENRERNKILCKKYKYWGMS